MKTKVFFSVFAISAMLVSCGNKQAAEVESLQEKEAISQKASSGVSAIRMAQDLVKYGYEVESAEALIEAANILASTPSQALEAEIEPCENDDMGEKADKASKSVGQILADAKEFAADDDVLLAMIAKVERKVAAQAEGTRGAFGGARSGHGRVYAHDNTVYSIKFWAHELAEVAVIGDGDTDLDVYVYDENGHLIASDTDYTDDCYVRWNPSWTGLFRIKVVNRGNVYNDFVIATN